METTGIEFLHPYLNPDSFKIGYATEAFAGLTILVIGAGSLANGCPIGGLGEYIGFMFAYNGIDNLLG